MRTPLKKLSLGLLVFSCWIGLGGFQARAEDAGAPSRDKREEKIAKWKQLKEENPEEFRRLIQERKQHLKERLQDLKEKDPEKFEEVKKRMFEHRREYLQNLRRENPDKYQEVVRRRRQKLDEFKTQNPERFKEFTDKHPRAAEHWDKRGQKRERAKRGRGPNF